MRGYLKWWLLMAACMVAAALLVPLSALVVGITKVVMNGLDHAHAQMALLRLRRLL